MTPTPPNPNPPAPVHRLTWSLAPLVPAGLLLLVGAAALAADPEHTPIPLDDGVVVDLRQGTVAGSHPAVSVRAKPVDRSGDGWHEAVLKVDLTGYRELEVVADFAATPSGWSLNVGDSATNNGCAGDARTQSNDAELEVKETGLRVWGNDGLAGPQKKLGDWGQRIDAGTRLKLRIRDGELFWETWKKGARVDFGHVTSPHLFALDGQADAEGQVNHEVFVALNRVVSGGRRGAGLAAVRVRPVR